MTDKDEQIVGEKAMEKMSVAPPDPDKDDKEDDGEMSEDEELSQGLKETFPASDPPANTQPGHDQPVPSSGYRGDEEEE